MNKIIGFPKIVEYLNGHKDDFKDLRTIQKKGLDEIFGEVTTIEDNYMLERLEYKLMDNLEYGFIQGAGLGDCKFLEFDADSFDILGRLSDEDLRLGREPDPELKKELTKFCSAVDYISEDYPTFTVDPDMMQYPNGMKGEISHFTLTNFGSLIICSSEVSWGYFVLKDNEVVWQGALTVPEDFEEQYGLV